MSIRAGVRLGIAWLVLCVALVLHVVDEALHDFLSVYNPVAMSIRERLPFLPLPVFTFESWLISLAAAICLLLLLTPFAFRRHRLMVSASLVFGCLMSANGVGHLLRSLYLDQLQPGVLSSPVLIGASLLLVSASCRERTNG